MWWCRRRGLRGDLRLVYTVHSHYAILSNAIADFRSYASQLTHAMQLYTEMIGVVFPKVNSLNHYFITDLSLVSLRAFTISPLTSLSDHSKTTFYLHRLTPSLEALQQIKLHSIQTCYHWEENSAETHQNAIKQQQVQLLLDQFLGKKCSAWSLTIDHYTSSLKIRPEQIPNWLFTKLLYNRPCT